MPLSTVFHIRLSVPKGFKFILAVSAQDIVILRFVSVLHLSSGRALERYTLSRPSEYSTVNIKLQPFQPEYLKKLL